ncbi:MAG: hypothetical protein JW818_11090 [Pirellulales bacterium]|nr:hypothetical protein [Pirellulales bacterium]
MNVAKKTSLILLVAALGAGCGTSRWATPAGPASSAPPAAPPTTTTPTAPAPTASPAPPVPSLGANTAGQPDPALMARVMAEVQAVGQYDRAAQDQLVAELQQAEPAVWPAVVQSFRSRLAYSQRLRQHEAAETQALAAARPCENGASPPAASWSRQPATETIQLAQASAGSERPKTTRLPTPHDAALPPDSPPEGTYPKTVAPNPPLLSATEPVEPPTSEKKTSTDIQQASYSSQPPHDWRGLLTQAIAGLEQSLAQADSTEASHADHARLRLLQLAAGHRDEALQPIPHASPAESDFWSKEFYGLAALLDTSQIPEPTRRAAEAKRHLNDATVSLSELAPLEIRNLAFCRKVQSYGNIERFPTYVFKPGDPVLLYAEVENYRSEPTPKGYCTVLKNSYQIFDSAGNRVEERSSAPTEDYCDHPRRDYFVGCEFNLPNRLYPGKHTLKLTVEDLKGQRVGESSIEFEVKVK